MYRIEFDNGTYLEHHGTKGQKWGIRKYQNADGSLTSKGKKRYKNGLNADNSIKSKKTAKLEKKLKTDTSSKTQAKLAKSRQQDAWKQTRNSYAKNQSSGKKVAKVMLMGAFGTYTYNSMRAAGKGRAVSAGVSIVSNKLGGPLGNALASSIVADTYKSKNLNIKSYNKSVSKDVSAQKRSTARKQKAQDKKELNELKYLEENDL